jgi:hypothetical protein
LLQTILEVQRGRVDRDRRQDLALGWILNLMARHQLATETPIKGHLVIDEGFAQRAVALVGHGFEPGPDQSVLDEYLAVIPRPDLVVAVATPLEVCRQRMEERGWSERVADLDAAARESFLISAGEVVARVATGLEAAGIMLIWVDGTTPPPDSLSRVAASLRP